MYSVFSASWGGVCRVCLVPHWEVCVGCVKCQLGRCVYSVFSASWGGVCRVCLVPHWEVCVGCV